MDAIETLQQIHFTAPYWEFALPCVDSQHVSGVMA